MTDGLDAFWRERNSRRVGTVGFVLGAGQVRHARINGDVPVDVFAASDTDAEDAGERPGVVVKVTAADHEPARGVVVALVDADGGYREATIGAVGRVLFLDLPEGPVRCAVGGAIALERSTDAFVSDVTQVGVSKRFAEIVDDIVDIDAALTAFLDERSVADDEVVVSRTDIDEGVFTWRGTPSKIGLLLPAALEELLGGTDLTVESGPDYQIVRITCDYAVVPDARVFVVMSSAINSSVATASVDVWSHVITARIPWPHPEPPTEVRIAVAPT